MPDKPKLKLIGAGANRGTFKLSGIEFDISSGEVLAVLGPSGCGKSTLLEVISGLGEGNFGQVTLDGDKLSKHSPYYRDTALMTQELVVCQKS